VLEDRDQLDGALKEMAVETVRLRERYQLGGKGAVEAPASRGADETERADDMPAAEASGSDIEGIVASRMDELLEKLSRGEAMDSDAFRAVQAWLNEERERILEETRSSQSGRIDLLKRRIAKLSAKLNEAEDRLAQSETVEDLESGLASEYRSVQGLAQGSEHYEAKKAVLKEIFDLNRELRKLTPCGASA
jgi:hypothetical protein